jgi:2-phosphoglycerate kinase
MAESIVYLIGGPPGGGKTTLGRQLARRLDLPSVTIDDFRTAILAVTSPDSHPDLHWVGMPNAVDYFTNREPDQMIRDALAQHVALWPAVERVIVKRLRGGAGCVIDGWHLLPRDVSSIAERNLVPVWLDVDADVLEERERLVWDFYAESPNPKLMFANFMARSLRWNELVCDQARDLGLRVMSQDGSKSPDDLCDEVLSPL